MKQKYTYKGQWIGISPGHYEHGPGYRYKKQEENNTKRTSLFIVVQFPTFWYM